LPGDLQEGPDAVELRLEPPALAVERLVAGRREHGRERRRGGRAGLLGLGEEHEPVLLAARGLHQVVLAAMPFAVKAPAHFFLRPLEQLVLALVPDADLPRAVVAL